MGGLKDSYFHPRDVTKPCGCRITYSSNSSSTSSTCSVCDKKRDRKACSGCCYQKKNSEFTDNSKYCNPCIESLKFPNRKLTPLPGMYQLRY